jgi:hypothetical protein
MIRIEVTTTLAIASAMAAVLGVSLDFLPLMRRSAGRRSISAVNGVLSLSISSSVEQKCSTEQFEGLSSGEVTDELKKSLIQPTAAPLSFPGGPSVQPGKPSDQCFSDKLTGRVQFDAGMVRVLFTPANHSMFSESQSIRYSQKSHGL